MRAVRIHEYGGPEVLVAERVERPEPGPGQVLVRVKAAAVNQVDAAIRRNAFPTPKQLPRILGSDGAGVVEAVGSDVDTVQAGDEVFFTGLSISTDGSYAEYAALPAAVMAVPKPASVSFEEAASLGVAFSAAWYALVRRGELLEGETVLVQGGAGGVGSAAVQLARALGARVLATVVHATDVAGVLELGAEAVVDASAADVVAEVRRLTDDRGVDVVVELIASENLAADVGLIVRGGRIVVLGAGPRPEATVPTGPAIGVDADIRFANAGNAGRAGTAETLARIAALVDDGKLKPVVGHVLPLEQARQAHELLDGHHFGKIVLVP